MPKYRTTLIRSKPTTPNSTISKIWNVFYFFARYASSEDCASILGLVAWQMVARASNAVCLFSINN